MAQSGNITFIQSVSTVNFTGSIAQNAGITEDIFSPSLGPLVRSRVRSIVIYAAQNLAWEVQFYGAEFSSSAVIPGAIDTESFLGRWTFQVSDGVQGPVETGGGNNSNPVGGNWFYYIDGLDIAYEDRDIQPVVIAGGPQGAAASGGQVGTSTLHIALVNRSATSKVAGLAGGVVVRVGFESTLGWS